MYIRNKKGTISEFIVYGSTVWLRTLAAYVYLYIIIVILHKGSWTEFTEGIISRGRGQIRPSFTTRTKSRRSFDGGGNNK